MTMTDAAWLRSAALAVTLALGGMSLAVTRAGAEDMHAVPAPTLDEHPAADLTSETAIIAGGCFWGVQGVFQHVRGVTNAVSGYAGGAAGTAHYDTVSTGRTGHAEAVRITFNPQTISYGKILQIYFSAAHDPTERNRQGPDTGTQYRSTIFPTSDEQASVARAYKAQLAGAHVYRAPIVTTIEPGRAFYPAEQHHQNYLARNPTDSYIAANDIPKVAAVKQLYPDFYRGNPVLVAGVASAN